MSTVHHVSAEASMNESGDGIGGLNERVVVLTKGATDAVLEICTHIRVGDEERKMGDEEKKAASEVASTMAREGLREFAMAMRVLSDGGGGEMKVVGEETPVEDIEQRKIHSNLSLSLSLSLSSLSLTHSYTYTNTHGLRMTFLGVVGMIDPPRESVVESIATCHEAGIRVFILTGDHAETALQ